MSGALLWGLAAGSSLLIGGILALEVRIDRRVLRLVMAFGAGVLISAVAYELVQEAFHVGAGSGGVAFGLFAGAAGTWVWRRRSDSRSRRPHDARVTSFGTRGCYVERTSAFSASYSSSVSAPCS